MCARVCVWPLRPDCPIDRRGQGSSTFLCSLRQCGLAGLGWAGSCSGETCIGSPRQQTCNVLSISVACCDTVDHTLSLYCPKGARTGSFRPPLAAPRRCRVDTMSDRPPGRPNKVWGGVGPTTSETRRVGFCAHLLAKRACRGGDSRAGAGERDFLGSIPRRQVGIRVTRSGDAGFRSGSAALRGNARIDPAKARTGGKKIWGQKRWTPHLRLARILSAKLKKRTGVTYHSNLHN